MSIEVKARTIPPAGIDTTEVTIEESYDIHGVGKDTVTLKGTLVSDRGAPLLQPGKQTLDWNSSIVAARFTNLRLSGKRDVFGTGRGTLDKRFSAAAAAIGCHCSASLGVVVSIPRLVMKLKTSEAIQLQSEVTTIPPVGDELTASVHAVDLVDADSNRKVGTLSKATVKWRDLVAQKRHGAK